MNKLITVIVATTFALGSAAGFAADTTPKKNEDLTKEDRADMRARADRLTTARAQGQPEHHVAAEPTKAKKQQPKKSKSAPAKKAEPKA